MQQPPGPSLEAALHSHKEPHPQEQTQVQNIGENPSSHRRATWSQNSLNFWRHTSLQHGKHKRFQSGHIRQTWSAASSRAQNANPSTRPKQLGGTPILLHWHERRFTGGAISVHGATQELSSSCYRLHCCMCVWVWGSAWACQRVQRGVRKAIRQSRSPETGGLVLGEAENAVETGGMRADLIRLVWRLQLFSWCGCLRNNPALRTTSGRGNLNWQ